MRTALAPVAVVAGLLMAGCSAPFTGSPTPVPSPAQTAEGYLGSGSSWASFVQLVRSGDSLSGTLDETAVNYSTEPPLLQSNHFSVKGTEQGSNVALTLSASLFGETALSGHFEGSTLYLELPQPGGTLDSVGYAPGTLDEYNAAVSKLNQQVVAARSTPTPEPTPASDNGSGTYWACESDQSDAGIVDPSADSRLEAQGGVPSPVCQQHMQLNPGAHAFRVPVGHFAPFRHCGVTVANIVDPYDAQAAPSSWIGAHEYLFDAAWNQVAEGTC